MGGTPIRPLPEQTSLNELPLFINVPRGEMPLSVRDLRSPTNSSVWHRTRLLAAKPGITGSWLVSGAAT